MLKSRVVWLQSGDKNTKFFQNFANERRLINSMCNLKDKNDALLFYQNALEEGEISFFQEVYLHDSHLKIEDHLKVVSNFPRF